ncbi:MAG: TetR/AcrR family transcriptional regulator [Candidatus Sericytochromatia bacterium]|nr:TetR/AcrR family transcriptional regulator [Candidatus Sericytochromatia bacterium]
MMNTEEKIIEVALELFSNKGFANSSMREIAEKVGIKASSIYNHFKSKEEILLKLINYYSTSDEILSSISEEDIIKDPFKILKKIAYSMAFIDRSEFELKIKRLILIEQVRVEIARTELMKKYNFMNNYVLPNIFNLLQTNGIIKKIDVHFLTKQFIAPFFMKRIEIALFSLKDEYEKENIDLHLDFFWDNIKI